VIVFFVMSLPAVLVATLVARRRRKA